MYIAIVADNVADRKQAERLLGRANTALAPTLGTLYISAYGDESSFLHECMKFDLFLLDFDHDTDHSLRIVRQLQEMNAPGIAAICKDAETPFSYETAIAGVYTIDKPILTAPLHKLITDAHQEAEQRRRAANLIELRGEKDTHYIPKDDIVYIEINDLQHTLIYHLVDGTTLPMVGTVWDVDRALGMYPQFQLKTKSLAVNTDYVKEEDKKSILLTTGERFSYPLLQRLFPNK